MLSMRKIYLIRYVPSRAVAGPPKYDISYECSLQYGSAARIISCIT